MDAERWSKVGRLCHAALTHGVDQRAAFLADVCAGDDGLRREIESLLAQESAAVGFMSTPAIAGELMDDGVSFIGRQVGPYAIHARLGAGGMGEVYRAHDAKLGRDVAIKILPRLFTNDPERLLRFEREARILAALNHPNIGAIYGLEDVEGIPALVLELVEGPTLAERLAHGPLTVAEAMTIATQITDALEAAHDRGIVHRDLKPANIKVTPTGTVKVLDFGLAKGLGDERLAPSTDAVTVAASQATSSPGAVLGTITYMSPEQARGEPVDVRTDLFSFGTVLYEMVTQRPAFTGANSLRTVHAILHQSPPPPRSLNPAVPLALERIILKLLAKDRHDRYQTGSDVRIELKRLEREIETGRWATLVASNRRRGLVVGAALTMAIALAVWLWPHLTPRPQLPRGEYTQITHFADSVTSPSLSPDGRMLTFIRGDDTFIGSGQVYVKALPDGEPVQLTHDTFEKGSPVFSLDGSRIAYTTKTGRFLLDTWVVPVAGGEPRLWLANASGLSWINPHQVLFSAITTGLHMNVVAAGENRDAVRTVYRPGPATGMAHRSQVSPDGRWVLVVEMDAPVWQPCRIVPIEGLSTGRRVGPAAQCTSAAWSPDGTWMYFSSNASGNFHIWRQHFPDGAPEQITAGPTEEEGVALAPDGRSLLTAIGNRQSSMWVHDVRGEREVSREGYAFVPKLPIGMSQPFSTDGHKLIYLVRQGSVHFTGPEERIGELWMTDLETGRNESLFPGVNVIGWDISRDGSRIVYAAVDDIDTSHIWLARLDHRAPPRQLSSLEADNPRFGGGDDIFCRGREGGSNFIYRIRADGGPPEKAVASPVIFFMSASPDGAWLMARVPAAGSANSAQTNLAFPTTGGSPVPFCDLCDVDWTPSAESLVVRLSSADGQSPNRTYVIALESPGTLPRLPAGGIRSEADLTGLHILQSVDGYVHPSDTATLYAFGRSPIQRNIYRVPLP
jgi:eukaryotic-like serine/threonine-protein kinase